MKKIKKKMYNKQKTKEKNKNNNNNKLYLIINLTIISITILLFLISHVSLKIEIKKLKTPDEKIIKITKNDNFVFLGDSITAWYPFNDLYDDYIPIVNSGKAGYNTRDILNNMENMVYIYNPTKVFILIGTNDLNNDIPNEETLSNIKKIIKNIKNNRPSAKIYVQSIYPINNTDNAKINKRNVGKRTNEIIIEMNKKIKEICQEQKVTYIDVYSELIDKNGNLNIDYTADGLHLSNRGYLKVTKHLLPYVEE